MPQYGLAEVLGTARIVAAAARKERRNNFLIHTNRKDKHPPPESAVRGGKLCYFNFIQTSLYPTSSLPNRAGTNYVRYVSIFSRVMITCTRNLPRPQNRSRPFTDRASISTNCYIFVSSFPCAESLAGFSYRTCGNLWCVSRYNKLSGINRKIMRIFCDAQ